MAKYMFNLAKKVIIWEDNHFTVEAETEEEARQIATQFMNPDSDVTESEDYRVDFIESEFVLETEQDMTVEQNDGFPVRELKFLG